jgi:endo-1,4-beta-mannosidase
MTAPPMAPFRLGLNYWPAKSAMAFWSSFDRGEVMADFERIAAERFDSLRLFLLWEHFQPRPERIDRQIVDRLVSTLDMAAATGLVVMPTLFTGHMSGVNWIPSWALGGIAGDRRFRVVSGERVVNAGLRNWYLDVDIARAQALLAKELAATLRGHPALWAWDLGNENSNCVRPPTRQHGRDWLARLGDALRAGDDSALVTTGLHMEDLEQDRCLGPGEAAEICDFLTMHGYPGYAAWSRGPTDESLLPFLATVTRWLGGGAEVLFSEFGVPTYRAGDGASVAARRDASTTLVEECDAAAYTERALVALHAAGCSGAMLWCHADYPSSLWQAPPFDVAVHERSFGLWHSDGSPKPAVEVIARFGTQAVIPSAGEASWLDLERDEFYRDPSANLARLYRRYCAAVTRS